MLQVTPCLVCSGTGMTNSSMTLTWRPSTTQSRIASSFPTWSETIFMPGKQFCFKGGSKKFACPHKFCSCILNTSSKYNFTINLGLQPFCIILTIGKINKWKRDHCALCILSDIWPQVPMLGHQQQSHRGSRGLAENKHVVWVSG